MEKGTTFNVLDNGYVKYIDSMGSDENIIEAARMSTGRGFEGWEKDFSLLDFLWSHKHATPFEMCELAIEVQAPIMVFREWHRHRTQSYNEFSARYSKMPDLHYLPKPERIQKQSSTNKQGSDGQVAKVIVDEIIHDLGMQQSEVYESYDRWIGAGVAKEVARLNTPVSRYSKMRAKTDLRNWLAFCNLRMRPNAQWEIRQYAETVGRIIKDLWPRTWKLFEEYDLYAVQFSRTEILLLQKLLDGGPSGWSGALSEFAEQEQLSEKKTEELFKKLRKGGLEIL